VLYLEVGIAQLTETNTAMLVRMLRRISLLITITQRFSDWMRKAKEV
jgi:hypothetical protein